MTHSLMILEKKQIKQILLKHRASLKQKKVIKRQLMCDIKKYMEIQKA